MAAKPMFVPAGTGPAYRVYGCVFRFLVSSEEAGGSYTTMEITVPPGAGANMHVHDGEEEQFYILQGELTYWIGDDTIEASTGDLIHIPRGTLHGFKNKQTPAKLLATFSPATGIEILFQQDGELISDDVGSGR